MYYQYVATAKFNCYSWHWMTEKQDEKCHTTANESVENPLSRAYYLWG